MEPGYQKKTRGKGLKRLRRVNSFHKKHEPEVEGVAAAIGEKKSKKKKKSKATREETDEKDESNSEAKNKRKAKVKEEENRSRKVAKRTSNVEAPVDDKVKKMVIDILQECRKTIVAILRCRHTTSTRRCFRSLSTGTVRMLE